MSRFKQIYPANSMANIVYVTLPLGQLTFYPALYLLVEMASPTGIEPVTYSLGGSRAIQLCHGDIQSLGDSSIPTS